MARSRSVVAVVLAVMIGATGCAGSHAKPLSWYIGQPTSVLSEGRTPAAIASIVIHPAGEKRIGWHDGVGPYVILAICSTSEQVPGASQVGIAKERENRLTKQILAAAKRGVYEHLAPCRPIGKKFRPTF